MNTEGYRTVPDHLCGGGYPCKQCQHPIDGPMHWIEDAHGGTVAGPVCSPFCGREWLVDWRALLERQRAIVEAQQVAVLLTRRAP
jgi:hypothetical protein